MPHSESTDRPSAGVLILDGRIVVRVTGDDRASFLHGMCTADVNGARPGTILPALFLTEHAHVIADAFIWVTSDALLLDIDAEAWTRTRAHLEKLLVADDVEFEDATELALIDVEGPAALDTTGATSLAPWTFIEDAKSLVGNLPRYGGPAATVIAPRSSERFDYRRNYCEDAGFAPHRFLGARNHPHRKWRRARWRRYH